MKKAYEYEFNSVVLIPCNDSQDLTLGNTAPNRSGIKKIVVQNYEKSIISLRYNLREEILRQQNLDANCRESIFVDSRPNQNYLLVKNR